MQAPDATEHEAQAAQGQERRMSDIEDLEARIAGALERIRAGVENLSAVPAQAEEVEGLATA